MTCQQAQRACQPLVGESNRVGPGEPVHLLALAPRRVRVSVGSRKQIAQVEVHVTGGGGMDVDMYQPGARKRMPQCSITTAIRSSIFYRGQGGGARPFMAEE